MFDSINSTSTILSSSLYVTKLHLSLSLLSLEEEAVDGKKHRIDGRQEEREEFPY